jgi:hypothetical protein
MINARTGARHIRPPALAPLLNLGDWHAAQASDGDSELGDRSRLVDHQRRRLVLAGGFKSASRSASSLAIDRAKIASPGGVVFLPSARLPS